MIEVAQWKNDSFFPPLCGDGFHRTSEPLYKSTGCKLCVWTKKLGVKTFNICGKVVEFPEKFAISIPMPRIIQRGWNTFKEAKGESEYFRILWRVISSASHTWGVGPDCLDLSAFISGPPDHASQPLFLPQAETVIDNYKIFSYQTLELDESGQINKTFNPPVKSVDLGSTCEISSPFNITLEQEYSIRGGLTCGPGTEEVRFVLTVYGHSVSSGPVCHSSGVNCGGKPIWHMQESFHLNQIPREVTFNIPEELFFEPATNSNVRVNYVAEDLFSYLGCSGGYSKVITPASSLDDVACEHLSSITRTTVSYIPLEA